MANQYVLFLLDVAAINSYILHKAKLANSDSNEMRLRRCSAEKLSQSLIEIGIRERMLDWQCNNASGIQSSLKQAAISRGYFPTAQSTSASRDIFVQKSSNQ